MKFAVVISVIAFVSVAPGFQFALGSPLPQTNLTNLTPVVIEPAKTNPNQRIETLTIKLTRVDESETTGNTSADKPQEKTWYAHFSISDIKAAIEQIMQNTEEEDEPLAAMKAVDFWEAPDEPLPAVIISEEDDQSSEQWFGFNADAESPGNPKKSSKLVLGEYKKFIDDSNEADWFADEEEDLWGSYEGFEG